MPELDLLMALPYSVQVVPDECTDGSVCYLAKVVELDGCESHGDTAEEALDNLQEAKRVYLESMLADGVKPPLPVAVTTGVSFAQNTIWTVDTSTEPVGPVGAAVVQSPTTVRLGNAQENP